MYYLFGRKLFKIVKDNGKYTTTECQYYPKISGQKWSIRNFLCHIKVNSYIK